MMTWKASGHIEVEETTPEISLYAIYGTQIPQTMHIKGIIGRLVVTVLVDSRSTHNFLSQDIAEKLRLLPLMKGTLR